MITSGGLDIYLTRPIGVLRQMIFQRFGDTFIGQIIVTIIFLSVAVFTKSSIMATGKLAYLVFSVIGGVLIQAGAMILIGSISFLTKRSSEIGDIFYYDLRKITQYPLSIFPRWIQLALTYIFPWAFINYYPALILLNKTQVLSDIVLGLLSPIIGLLVLGLSLFVFNQGLKKYSGAGS